MEQLVLQAGMKMSCHKAMKSVIIGGYLFYVHSSICIIFTKEVMFSVDLVCLFVCLLAILPQKL